MTRNTEHQQTVLSSREEIKDILSKNRAKNVMVVCDHFVMGQPIQQYLDTLPYNFTYFTEFKPNPLYEDAVCGARVFKEQKCNFIISIGGGSAIDTAKSIKMFSELNLDEDCLSQLYADNGLLHLAIPTTAGTGSEATRFGVLYKGGVKQSLNHLSLIPDYVLLEPSLLTTLPMYQKKATMCDALCQAVESYWSVNATIESQNLAHRAIVLILANYRDYLKNNQNSYPIMMQASYLAGQAINLTQTTAAHAMCYNITALFGAAHGHAVAICLRHIWPFLKANADRCTDQRGPVYLNKILGELDILFGGDGPARFASFVDEMDFPQYHAEDEQLKILCAGVNPIRMKNFPITLSEEEILDLYRQITNYYLVEPADPEIRQLQKIELDMLKAAATICHNHNLRFYLSEGTLLGGIRHQGFVPWDDDLDIMMPRKDYEEFIKYAQTELPKKNFELQSELNIPTYWRGGIKICYLGPSKFRRAWLARLTPHNGPFIDILPLDNCYGPDDKRTKRLILDYRRYHAMLVRKNKINKCNTWRKKIVYLLSLFYSAKQLQKQMFKAQRRYENATDANWYINTCSVYQYQREVFDKSIFEPARMVNFVDTVMPVPAQAEDMLVQIYHDYKQMPPVEKRIIRHSWSSE